MEGFNSLRKNYGLRIAEIAILLKYYLIPPSTQPETLTKREIVALELGISPVTVRNYVTSIRAGLPINPNSRDDGEVIRWAIREKIISFDNWVERMRQTSKRDSIESYP